MKPWETLAQDTTPDGAALTLSRRGDELAIRVAGQLLMSSRQHGSEEALAEVACEGLERRPAPKILIGGLGMGFTLRAALDRLPTEARVVVAELLPAIVDWNRGVLGPLAGRPLSDSRVEVVAGDVRAVIGSSTGVFDAIALDVDNGPSALSSPKNAALYGRKGLESAHRALKPGGVYVVWSASEDPAFVRRLEQCGFRVQVERPFARSAPAGTKHVLFVGRRREP